MSIVFVISRTDRNDYREEVPMRSRLVMGQSVYCDIKLEDKLISSMQCQLQTTKTGHVVVTNLDLKRDVFINQSRLKKASLRVDDVLKIGPFVITIDPSKLTPAELEVMNTEYIEYC